MGWTHCSIAYCWKDKVVNGRHVGVVDRRKECDKLLTWCRTDEKGNVVSSGEVLKSAMVGRTYYAAVRNNKGEVWAAVFLTCGKTKWDNTLWGYKDMDETMGPSECKCPASILALLTPTDSKWANEWRQKCRENITMAAEMRKNGPKPIYAPSGEEVHVEGKSWVITSKEYLEHCHYRYRGVKMAKARWHDSDTAVMWFLNAYGTKEQKAEYAASGLDCPAEWKGSAA